MHWPTIKKTDDFIVKNHDSIGQKQMLSVLKTCGSTDKKTRFHRAKQALQDDVYLKTEVTTKQQTSQ